VHIVAQTEEGALQAAERQEARDLRLEISQRLARLEKGKSGNKNCHHLNSGVIWKRSTDYMFVMNLGEIGGISYIIVLAHVFMAVVIATKLHTNYTPDLLCV
jgi:hypothetical protein